MKTWWALYASTLRAADTRARRLGFAALSILGVVVAWAVSRSYFVFDPLADAVQLLDVFNLNFLAPVAGLVFGTATLGDPTEDNTLVYLWLRPIPRWKLATAATAAAATFTVPYSVVPAVVEGWIVAGHPVLGAAVLSTAAAAVAYAAVFVLLGLVSRRSLVWGIGYLLIFESFVARGGRSLGALSIHAHAASILADTADRELRLGYFSASTGIASCAVITVLALAVTTWRLNRAEVP